MSVPYPNPKVGGFLAPLRDQQLEVFERFQLAVGNPAADFEHLLTFVPALLSLGHERRERAMVALYGHPNLTFDGLNRLLLRSRKDKERFYETWAKALVDNPMVALWALADYRWPSKLSPYTVQVFCQTPVCASAWLETLWPLFDEGSWRALQRDLARAVAGDEGVALYDLWSPSRAHLPNEWVMAGLRALEKKLPSPLVPRRL